MENVISSTISPAKPETLCNGNKIQEEFRNFNNIRDSVRQTYLKMHSQQTVKLGKEMREKWLGFGKAKMTIMEALDNLNNFVDDSDPDIEESPNSHHAYQTAEMLRAKYPDLDWLHLVGLVHDMGKMMCILDKNHEQFATVGDTYIVGCAPRDSIVLRDVGFELNPDTTDPAFNSKLGMYTENCGLDNVMMTWGHDEYMYSVLKNHPDNKIPDEGMFIIRYHSFYPLHDRDDYQFLLSNKDRELVKWLKLFRKFDLYSKDDHVAPQIEELQGYYQQLIDKYIPGLVAF